MIAFFPGRPEIEAYGGGGFRFGGISHRGSILALPSGVYAWNANLADLKPVDFEKVLAERSEIDTLFLGTGRNMMRPPASVREAVEASGMLLDFMATGSAVPTYNLLLAERRKVAAALIAVTAAA